MRPLAKSCRTLRRLEARADIRRPLSPAYRDAIEYRRALYAEYGAEAVRRELAHTTAG